ncbi:cutinase [Coprinopsis sp. MPI-PUGE-AT-0042]|nr:cutinase [Coprinopsis sp. MPI-PUGE-AT-0042]
MKFTTLVAVALSAAVSLAAPVEELESRQAGCSSVFVYFARGTNETPTLGTQIGPQLRDALAGRVGGLSFVGISYPANVAGYLAGGDAGGAKTMADAVASTAARCPSAKIFLSGYSQGAQVAHKAARQLSAANQNRVTGHVSFGDPYRDTALPGALQNRRRTFCNDGDQICNGLPIITDPHGDYTKFAATAAAWIAARV